MAFLSDRILCRGLQARYYRCLVRAFPAHYSLAHRWSFIHEIEGQREGLRGFHVKWGTDRASNRLLELACLNLATYQVLYSKGFPEHQVLYLTKACTEQLTSGITGRLLGSRSAEDVRPWLNTFFSQNGLPQLAC